MKYKPSLFFSILLILGDIHLILHNPTVLVFEILSSHSEEMEASVNSLR